MEITKFTPLFYSMDYTKSMSSTTKNYIVLYRIHEGNMSNDMVKVNTLPIDKDVDLSDYVTVNEHIKSLKVNTGNQLVKPLL